MSNALFIGKNLIRLNETDSTNSHLARLVAEKELMEGTVVITNHQQSGRGQRGTNWESEAGKNLTLSVLLYPKFLLPDEQFLLNKIVALAAADFIGNFFFPFSVKIKWPNDIYVNDKKIAGILIENSMSGNKLQHSIVGIGVNVNQEKFSAELPNPVSLKQITEKKFELNKCLEELCCCLEKRYFQLKASKQKQIDDDYLSNLYRLNEFANYNLKGKNIKAKITGVTKIGKLILENDSGKKLECDFKEVTFLLTHIC